MPFYNTERIAANGVEMKRMQGVSISFESQHGSPNHVGGNKTYSTNVQDLLSAALSLNYVAVEGFNEATMGIDGNFIGKLVSGLDIKNYQIQVSGGGTINVTGAALISYNNSCSVGDYAKATASFEVFDLSFTTGTPITGASPTIAVPAILAGHINLTVTGGFGVTNFSLEEYDLSVSVNRDYAKYIGDKTPSIKRVSFPVEAEVSVRGYLEGFQVANISDFFTNKTGYGLSVTFKNKSGVNTSGGFSLTNAYLVSQDISNEALGRTQIDMTFKSALGLVDSKDAPKGVLMIGI